MWMSKRWGWNRRRQRKDDNGCGGDGGEREDDRESMNTVRSEMGVKWNTTEGD